MNGDTTLPKKNNNPPDKKSNWKEIYKMPEREFKQIILRKLSEMQEKYAWIIQRTRKNNQDMDDRLIPKERERERERIEYLGAKNINQPNERQYRISTTD
jgi:hypothetical protein